MISLKELLIQLNVLDTSYSNSLDRVACTSTYLVFVYQTYIFWLSLLCIVYSWSLSRTFSGSLIAMYCLCFNCPSNVPFLALLTQTDADDGQSGVAPEPVPGVKSFSRKHDIGALMVLSEPVQDSGEFGSCR